MSREMLAYWEKQLAASQTFIPQLDAAIAVLEDSDRLDLLQQARNLRDTFEVDVTLLQQRITVTRQQLEEDEGE